MCWLLRETIGVHGSCVSGGLRGKTCPFSHVSGFRNISKICNCGLVTCRSRCVTVLGDIINIINWGKLNACNVALPPITSAAVNTAAAY